MSWTNSLISERIRFFSNSKRTYTRYYLDSLINISNCFWFEFLYRPTKSYQSQKSGLGKLTVIFLLNGPTSASLIYKMVHYQNCVNAQYYQAPPISNLFDLKNCANKNVHVPFFGVNACLPYPKNWIQGTFLIFKHIFADRAFFAKKVALPWAFTK